MVKVGTVELLDEDAKKIYEERKYICAYSGIYAIHYSAPQKQFYGRKVIDYKGYARRGRFYIQSANEINRVFGEKILNED